AANKLPNALDTERAIFFTQKWHQAGCLERDNPRRGYYGDVMTIRLQCFDHAANVHGLRAAAHGAMVVYELQSFRPSISREGLGSPYSGRAPHRNGAT